jgi:hypothetical protein
MGLEWIGTQAGYSTLITNQASLLLSFPHFPSPSLPPTPLQNHLFPTLFVNFYEHQKKQMSHPTNILPVSPILQS